MALMKRVVVVGLGSIGRRHARLLQDRDDVEVQFCEPNDQMLSMARNEIGELPTYRTYEEALATEPDLIVIATPHQLHCEQTLRALARGIHVLCEKPMSDKLEDAIKMREAAEESNALLGIGFMLHFHPGLQRLKQLIDTEALGAIVAVNYKIGSYITLVNSKSRYQADMEDALLMDYAHQPDTIHWLLGKRPTGVYCSGTTGGDMEFSSNPNLLTVVCEFAEPLVATIMLNYLQMPERHECELVGDKGWALFDMKQGEIRIAGKDREDIAVEHVPVVRDEMYQEEHQVFLDAIEGKGSPGSPPAEALVSMEIIDAAIASRRRAQRVAL